MDLIIEPIWFLWNTIFTFYYTRVRPVPLLHSWAGRAYVNSLRLKWRFFIPPKQQTRFFLPRVRGMSDELVDKTVVLRINKNLKFHEPHLLLDSQTKISNLWYCHLRRSQRARWCLDGLRIDIYMYLCIHDILYIHDIHVHVHIHMYIHTYIYIHIYIYTYSINIHK